VTAMTREAKKKTEPTDVMVNKRIKTI